MKPYYQDKWVMQYSGNSVDILGGLADGSIDLLVTDPPYGIGFMGKDWDRALPDKGIWSECLRVMKPGAFGFVMSIPRADCLSRVIISLEDEGFNVGFSPIYWAYASGFPKAQNIGKAVDKRLGAEREVISQYSGVTQGDSGRYNWHNTEQTGRTKVNVTKPTSPQAKALDGSYGGFQPKPAVEVIIVCMKPLSGKTFVDQALKNGKGISWLDDGRIPTQPRTTHKDGNYTGNSSNDAIFPMPNIETTQPNSRFPANLLVSDDVLNDGKDRKARTSFRRGGGKPNMYGFEYKDTDICDYQDSGSFSRYFDLDKWWEERIKQLPASVQKTFPFLIVPKASKSEKNKGCEGLPEKKCQEYGSIRQERGAGYDEASKHHNNHPTVKPLKLMSYLITLGSREGDTVLDPFGGSGTTALASKLLGRKCIICEIDEGYCEIAKNRCKQEVMEL